MTQSATPWVLRLSGLAAALTGIFLILGAWGHFQAVVPQMANQPFDGRMLWLLIAGASLLIPGLINLALAWPLSRGNPGAYYACLVATLLALAYVTYLMLVGVSGHPISLFFGIVLGYTVLLIIGWRSMRKAVGTTGA